MKLNSHGSVGQRSGYEVSQHNVFLDCIDGSNTGNSSSVPTTNTLEGKYCIPHTLTHLHIQIIMSHKYKD